MPEQVKINPCAMKLYAAICRKVAPTAMTAGSFVNRASMRSDCVCEMTVAMNITPLPISAAILNVSRTRAPLPAPTFCPATGDAANATAIAGRKMDCMTRAPSP